MFTYNINYYLSSFFLKPIVFATIMFLYLQIELKAQTSFNAAGGNVSGNDGSVSYSIGQLFYTTVRGANASVAQGVQQAYEISVISSTDQNNNIELKTFIYPNPTKSNLILNMGNYESSNLIFQLYNQANQIIQQGKIWKQETIIEMSEYASAIYFVKVFHGEKIIKVYKIVKN